MPFPRRSRWPACSASFRRESSSTCSSSAVWIKPFTRKERSGKSRPVPLPCPRYTRMPRPEKPLRRGSFHRTRPLPFLFKSEVATIVLNLGGKHIEGMKLLPRIKEDFPQLPVIVVTGSMKIEMAVACIKAGAFDCLIKPMEKNRFLSHLEGGGGISHLRGVAPFEQQPGDSVLSAGHITLYPQQAPGKKGKKDGKPAPS